MTKKPLYMEALFGLISLGLSTQVSGADLEQVRSVKDYVIKNGEVREFYIKNAKCKSFALELDGKEIGYQYGFGAGFGHFSPLNPIEGTTFNSSKVLIVTSECPESKEHYDNLNVAVKDIYSTKKIEGHNKIIAFTTIRDGIGGNSGLDGIIDQADVGTIPDIENKKFRVDIEDTVSRTRIQNMYDKIISSIYTLITKK